MYNIFIVIVKRHQSEIYEEDLMILFDECKVRITFGVVFFLAPMADESLIPPN